MQTAKNVFQRIKICVEKKFVFKTAISIVYKLYKKYFLYFRIEITLFKDILSKIFPLPVLFGVGSFGLLLGVRILLASREQKQVDTCLVFIRVYRSTSIYPGLHVLKNKGFQIIYFQGFSTVPLDSVLGATFVGITHRLNPPPFLNGLAISRGTFFCGFPSLSQFQIIT